MNRMQESQGSNAIGLRPEEMRSLRMLLLARKAELLDCYSNLEEEVRHQGKEAGELSAVPSHPGDRGSDSFEQILSLALLDNESSAMREIDLALGRMTQGTYGSCEDCGNPIGRVRLRALPQTTLCRNCKSLEESLN